MLLLIGSLARTILRLRLALPTTLVAKLLQIEFRDRTVYQYFGVPAEVHDALMRAHSKGRCFNSLIRGRFDYSLVTNAPSAPS